MGLAVVVVIVMEVIVAVCRSIAVTPLPSLSSVSRGICRRSRMTALSPMPSMKYCTDHSSMGSKEEGKEVSIQSNTYMET